MSAVRAKFRVHSIERSQYGDKELRTIKMSPVYGGGGESDENRKFWEASPNGSLELGCVNLEAAERFELGQEFYLDFTPAPAAEAGK